MCKTKSFGSKKCFVCGSKFHLIRDCDFYENQLRLNNAPVWTNVENIPLFVPRPAYVPAGSRNRPAYVPAGSRNRTSYVPAGSRNRTSYVPAGSRNRTASVPAGRPFPAGWHNPTAQPMTRPKSHYFQQFRRSGSYNQMDMDGGRWGTAVKTSAGCSWQSNRPYMHWGTKNNGGSQQSTGEMIHDWHVFAAWEVVPTGLGDVNALYFTDKSSKYFTHLREILHLLDRQDLSKLYGMVVKHYEVNPLAGT
ncbi:hypothetical protein Tco_1159078 [Tanacetum coccineum]